VCQKGCWKNGVGNLEAGRSRAPPLCHIVVSEHSSSFGYRIGGEGRHTDQRSNKNTHIIRKGKETKRPCLRMLSAILAHHSSHSDDCAAEDAGDAAEEDHLPESLGQAEECAGEGHAEERDDESGFPAEAVGCLG
jgi:hypothetical protein